MNAVRRLVLIALGWALSASCDGPAAPGDVRVEGLDVDAPVTALHVGDTVRLTANARDLTGAPLSRVLVRWSSSSPETAAIDSAGRVVARAEGVAAITAAAGGREALVQLTVSSPAARIVIFPTPLGLRVGDRRAISATATRRDGLPVTARRISWSSRNASVATVDSTGTVSGVSAGTAIVVAAMGTVADSARVAVSGPTARVRIVPDSLPVRVGERWTLRVRSEDAEGNEVIGVPVSWSSTDPEVAVLDSVGTARGVRIGRARVSATVEGVRGSGIVDVVSALVDSMALWPSAILVQAGSTRDLQVDLLGAGGRRVTGPAVTWTSSDPEVASVDERGMVRGRAAGRAEIRARSEGREANAVVHVVAYPTPLDFRSVYTNEDQSCGLTEGGRAYCWGRNSSDQLGTTEALERCGSRTATSYAAAGGYSCASLPRPVSTQLTFTTLSVGGSHVCGLTADGAAYCWGSNAYGEIGSGSPGGTARTPRMVAGGLKFSTTSAGANFTCGVEEGGRAYCWGYNGFGQLGTGDLERRAAPTRVAGDQLFANVWSGNVHSCGLTAEGKAYCWGRNGNAELGASATPDGCGAIQCVARPGPVNGGLLFRELTLGGTYTCGLDADGRAYCWGSVYGLGGASATEQCPATGPCTRTPTAVPTALRFKRLESNYAQTCGVTPAGSLHCWRREPPELMAGVPPLATFSYGLAACGI
ncbi:MAG: Ig-like domain-containing protein, partial [Gemmatimonadetes bacterium]|nr:Ig-like domain-containing protein [Gemmatimonadota bacterium]